MGSEYPEFEDMEIPSSVTGRLDNKLIRHRVGEDTFEFDPATGEATLYRDDGTYFRNTHDYDHGWAFRKPGMDYTQIRRSKKQVFFARLSLVMMGALLVLVYPFAAALFLAGNVPNIVAILGVLGVLSFGATISINYVHRSPVFQHTWNGRLMETDEFD